jgi:hypothetical protein
VKRKPLTLIELSEVVRIVRDWQDYYLTAAERDKLLSRYLTRVERFAVRPLLARAADGLVVEQLVTTATAGRTLQRARATRKKGGAT